ncbi:MAG: hypothetical protein AB7V42_08315 [Thermoleophilia bacterium]
MTTALAVVVAVAAGITGTWSPCGFSMVESLAAPCARRGRSVAGAASAAFAVGALAGGVVTFGLLSLLGSALGAGGTAALVAAALVAALAAAGELAGVRVLPQIRRQVPEPWRRTLPLPLASGLYGLLLGLGFTTFVMTFAVWVLAFIAVALGSVATGVAMGLAFGAGRAVPVAVIAMGMSGAGGRMLRTMIERPRLLAHARRLDGALLAALAAGLLAAILS